MTIAAEVTERALYVSASVACAAVSVAAVVTLRRSHHPKVKVSRPQSAGGRNSKGVPTE